MCVRCEIKPTVSKAFSIHQVDMLLPTKVTGIITQGSKYFGRMQFVGSYKLAFSNDGEKWLVYQDETQQQDKVKSFGSSHNTEHKSVQLLA